MLQVQRYQMPNARLFARKSVAGGAGLCYTRADFNTS